MSQTPMFESPVVAASTGDGYQRALTALVTAARAYLAVEDPDQADLDPLRRVARQVARELHAEDFRPRERMSRREVHRSALQRFVNAVDEYADLHEYDGGALGLRVWEGFESAVKSAARTADSYGPDDTTWAPDDDTNPIKVVPVPVPDQNAEPINGVRQGDLVQSELWDAPRRVLAGPDERGFVRLSDPRDGGGLFGGYFVPARDLGAIYVHVRGAA